MYLANNYYEAFVASHISPAGNSIEHCARAIAFSLLNYVNEENERPSLFRSKNEIKQ